MGAVARTGRRIGLGIALIATVAIGNPAWAGDDALRPYLEVRGLIDFRGVISSGTQSWEDGALGKTRYGGTANGKQRVLGNIAEATLLLEPHLFWDLTGVVQLTATPEAHVSPDVIEAFMHYKPVPSGPFGFRAKGGAFFPPFSLENSALGWTSPYTISSSAINTWIGEELRTVGGEATAYYRSDDWQIEVTGSLFTANDPTGTLLAWRGWTISDRKAGFLDRLILPALPVIRPPSRRPTISRSRNSTTRSATTSAERSPCPPSAASRSIATIIAPTTRCSRKASGPGRRHSGVSELRPRSARSISLRRA